VELPELYDYAGERAALSQTPRTGISPGFDDELVMSSKESAPGGGRWLKDPPANDGRKVVISNTDHYSPLSSDALWAWKSFLRGHNPVPVRPRDRQSRKSVQPGVRGALLRVAGTALAGM
jgi:hypothetical protein